MTHHGECIICKGKTSHKTTKRCSSCYRKQMSERSRKKGEKHFNWKGGVSINPWGYLRYNPTHKYGRRFVHVVVMEKKLGRKINSRIEKVHHINGNKLDNRPENLTLIDIYSHNHIHRPDLKNIRHPKYGYYIKKTSNPQDYSPHHIKRKRNNLGRFI